MHSYSHIIGIGMTSDQFFIRRDFLTAYEILISFYLMILLVDNITRRHEAPKLLIYLFIYSCGYFSQSTVLDW